MMSIFRAIQDEADRLQLELVQREILEEDTRRQRENFQWPIDASSIQFAISTPNIEGGNDPDQEVSSVRAVVVVLRIQHAT